MNKAHTPKQTTINGRNIVVARTAWRRMKRPSMRTMMTINNNVKTQR
jgi:hypothetical protein